MAVRLTPRPVPKVWGSTRLEPWFPDASEKIGEVWFEGTPQPPLLVKFLFTTEPLSVQVHPEGKTEMWHILSAEPGAKIGAGFREKISEERFRISALSGEIEQLLEWHEARPGDTFFIPAGTVHAIGAGLTLCEIQQWSDVTYRLFDYGRPRELHLDEGARVSRLGPHAARQSAHEGTLVACRHFTTEKLRVDGRISRAATMIVVLEGTLEIDGQVSKPGEVWHAATGGIGLHGQGTVLLTS
jgi:mannose-6-phosphate isomerase